jgi:hypothetical protein
MTSLLLALILTHSVYTQGTCPNGQVVNGVPRFGKPTCVSSATPAAHTHPGGDITTSVPTATSLAADPTDCTTPNFARGVNASGTAVCAQPAYSEISGAPAAYSLPDATGAVKGGIFLGGDLAGTAASPQVTDNSHAHTGSTISALDAGDVTTGFFGATRGGTGTATASNHSVLIGDGTGWVKINLPACNTQSDKLLYDQTARAITCGTDSTSETTPPGWTNVSTFYNSWTACPGTYGDVVPRYKKNPDGVVYVQMCVKNGAVNTVPFILPVGYRPAYLIHFKGTNGVADLLWSIDSAGNVKVVATAAGGDGYVRGVVAFPADSPQPLVATADHSGVSGSCLSSSGSCSATTSSVTCSATGGSPPYTYAWSYVSGTTATVDAATSATTTFTRTGTTGFGGNTLSGYYKCTVTDSVAVTDDTSNVNVLTTHTERDI